MFNTAAPSINRGYNCIFVAIKRAVSSLVGAHEIQWDPKPHIEAQRKIIVIAHVDHVLSKKVKKKISPFFLRVQACEALKVFTYRVCAHVSNYA